MNAPDIALLEPLADILGVSIVELIRGERIPQEEHTPVLAEQARELLVYSYSEVRRARARTWGMALLIAAACMLAVLLAVGAFCWKKGYFFVLEQCPSPDGALRRGLSAGKTRPVQAAAWTGFPLLYQPLHDPDGGGVLPHQMNALPQIAKAQGPPEGMAGLIAHQTGQPDAVQPRALP